MAPSWPDRRVIDVHAHVGPSSALGIDATVPTVLRVMDDNGIDMAVLSPIPGYEDPRGVADTATINDLVAGAVAERPQRFPCGLGVVEPRHGAAALDEVDRVLGDLGLAGLMFHNEFAGLPVDHPAMFAILERAAQHSGVIVSVHTGQHSPLEAPFQLGRLAGAYPEVTFINAHPMTSMLHLAASLDLARRHPTMLLDTCLTLHNLRPIQEAVEAIGAERLLFGSDVPYYAHSHDRDVVEQAELSDDAKDLIFAGNAARVFGLGR